MYRLFWGLVAPLRTQDISTYVQTVLGTCGSFEDTEEREILQHIQRNLEEASDLSFFNSIRLTEKNLSYSDILKKHQNYPDAGALYLDPMIFSPGRVNLEDCTLILREQKATKEFFKIQSHFVQGEIVVAQDHISITENGSERTAGLGFDKKIPAVHDSEDKICVEEFVEGVNSIAHGHVSAKETPSEYTTSPIDDKKILVVHCSVHDSEDQMCAEKFVEGVISIAHRHDSAKETPSEYTTSPIENKQLAAKFVQEKITQGHVSAKESPSQHTASPILDEKILVVHGSEDELLAEKFIDGKISIIEQHISFTESPSKSTKIRDETMLISNDSKNQILGGHVLTEQVQDVQTPCEINPKNHISKNVTIAVKSSTDRVFESQSKNIIIEGGSDKKILNEEESTVAAQIPEEKETTEHISYTESPPSKKMKIFDEKMLLPHEFDNQILGENVLTEQVQGIKPPCEINPENHISNNVTIEVKNSTDRIFESPSKNITLEGGSDDKILDEDEPTTTTQNPEEKEAAEHDSEKKLPDEVFISPCEINPENRIFNSVTIEVKNSTDRIFESPSKNITLDGGSDDKILDEEESTRTTQNAEEKETAEHDSEDELPDEVNMNESLNRLQIFNETNSKNISEDQSSLLGQNEIHTQAAEQVFETPQDNTTFDKVVDKSKKKTMEENLNEGNQVLDSWGVDENCNSVTRNSNDITSATEDINSKKVVDQSEWKFEEFHESNDMNLNVFIDNEDDKAEGRKDISFFNENDLLDIAKSWIIFDPNCPTKLNSETIDDASAQLLAGDKTLSHNAFYSSASVNLELPTNANNRIDDLNNVIELRQEPRIEICPPNLSNNSLVPDNLSLSNPIGNSTGLESFEPTDLMDDNDEDSESQNNSDGDYYIPSAAESSDTEASDADNEVPETSTRHQKNSKKKSLLDTTLGANIPGASAPDDTELIVSTSKAATSTKKHFCFYCQKFQSKIARHLELVHRDEEDVKKFSMLPPSNLERKEIISTIRKNGDHLYNTDKRFNTGELIVVRRPQERMQKAAVDFVACGVCKGQYSRSKIRDHFAKCSKTNGKKERLVMVSGRRISARVHEKASLLVRQYILPYMREDSVVRGIRYDKLLVLYANKQCEKYGLQQQNYQMIRGRLRLLGRFLMTVKEQNSAIKNFADIFKPGHYDSVIEAVKLVAGFNERTRLFAHPSLGSTLGMLIRQVGEVLRSEYIKEENSDERVRVENFLKLQSENYGTSVNRAVLETQAQNNRRKKVVLPSLDDITKLHNFLSLERETYFNQLTEEFSESCWRKLAEVLLISLQLFNRRRAGEMERVFVEDFNSYQGINTVTDKDTFGSLSKQGQALAKKYLRFMARGKRGRSIAVLVPANLIAPIKLVCKYRNQAGVSDENPYLFGIPSKNRDLHKYLRACDLMRQFSGKCGADLPSTLRGTQLRKHIATKCISLNLDENQVSDLANFMGHADKIHKEIYRQPVLQKDIITISQLLEKAQGTEESPADDQDANASSSDETGASSSGETEDNLNLGNASGVSKNTSTRNDSLASVSTGRTKTMHRKWTQNEQDTVLRAFKNIISAGKMPTGAEMQALINANDCLKHREVPQLRTWLHTQKKKQKKM